MKLTPAEALTATTINAAWSLGWGAETGSIEVGKRADLLIHEFDDYREIAYFIAAAFRPKVFIGGKQIEG
jgi:imidazolonepropionase